MAFIEDRLLDKVSYGFQIGPLFDTRITTLRNGHERRNRNWDTFKWRGTAPYNRIRAEHHVLLLGAHLACGGAADSFRFKNWMDYRVTGQSLGNAPAGSTAVQLVRDYETFGSTTHRRTITKPVSGTVTVYQNGVAKAGSTDTTTGLFTPDTAWTEGQPLTADFEYDIPMRFASDWLPFTQEEWNARTGEIELIEVLGE
jgi:uncharacterized protein (TIGR02217 family)